MLDVSDISVKLENNSIPVYGKKKKKLASVQHDEFYICFPNLMKIWNGMNGLTVERIWGTTDLPKSRTQVPSWREL